MHISVKKLRTKDQTGDGMRRMIRNYSNDLDNIFVRVNGKMVPFSSLSIQQAFEAVRRMPYRRDTKPTEVIARPGIIARNAPAGIDCKKKAILLAAYMKRRGIPYRLVASSKKKNRRIHHVFPQANLGGVWHNLDATYSHYRPFEKKLVTRAEVLK